MSIHINVITPEKLALTDEVDFVVAPAVDGEIGILPGHTPLLTRLGTGELRLKKGGETTFFFVAGGFLKVQKGNRIDVFAETAEMAEEMSLEEARQEAERAKSRLERRHDLTPEELAQVEAALGRAAVRMKFAEERRPRKKPPPGSQ